QGKFDLVPKALEKIGVRQVFHEIAQRPGKPVYFGVGPARQLVFGLPGNPVSTLISLVRYVVPALVLLSGREPPLVPHVQLAERVRFSRPTLTYFLPVSVRGDGRDTPTAQPQPPNGSGDFLSLTRADGFVELPPPGPFDSGFVARFYHW